MKNEDLVGGKTVYIVEQAFPYEGTAVLGVVSVPDRAIPLLKDAKIDRYGYFLTERKVDEAESGRVWRWTGTKWRLLKGGIWEEMTKR